jgi:kynurenine 3-monooxygenase
MSSEKSVAVVGAGLAGCLLACYLARRGYQVTMYERRPDPRQGTPERGRSINLALSERGLEALRQVDLVEPVLADALPMRGRMIHPVNGPLELQPYSADGQRAINSISRGALNNVLLNAAEAAGVKVHFDHRLVGLDPATGQMRFQVGDSEVTATAPVVLGADGAGSAVRGQLLAHDLLTERLEFLDYGYKELLMPARNGDFAMDPGALHIWPRGNSMMIALPNPDKTFTCTLFWPTGGSQSFASLSSPAAIERYFAQHYPDVPELIPNLVDDYQRNPIGLLGTVYCSPWHAHGKVALIGDASHGIVPFYAQGANAAFEDVAELNRCLDDTGDDWEQALPEYYQRRREHADAIAAMALENFVEMRDKVASPIYKTRIRIEHAVERAFPGKYMSRYEMVSFTTIPYAQVQRRARLQQLALFGGMAVAGLTAVTAAAAGLRRWLR